MGDLRLTQCSIKYKWKRPPALIPSGHGPGVPTQGDEKHLLFSNHSSCKRRPSLVGRCFFGALPATDYKGN